MVVLVFMNGYENDVYTRTVHTNFLKTTKE